MRKESYREPKASHTRLQCLKIPCRILADQAHPLRTALLGVISGVRYGEGGENKTKRTENRIEKNKIKRDTTRPKGHKANGPNSFGKRSQGERQKSQNGKKVNDESQKRQRGKETKRQRGEGEQKERRSGTYFPTSAASASPLASTAVTSLRFSPPAFASRLLVLFM